MCENFKIELLILLIIVIAVIVIIIVKSDIFKKYPYKKRNLLTKTEYKFYKVLKKECDRRDYLICPKVRMEDFLEVTCKENRLKYRGYIKSRHIDFIICDSELRMLCGIELDDYTHDTREAKKADVFKNNVFKKIAVPLFRIYVGQESYEEQLQEVFYRLKK